VFGDVVSEDDLVVLKQCMRNYLRPSAAASDVDVGRRSFNLRDPPKIAPRMNGTSRIRLQLHAYRVLQLCGAIIDHMKPIEATLKENDMSFADEVRDKIRAVQQWSPTQLQLAFERAEFERLRDLANSAVRSSSTTQPLPAKHNKSSRIRYRSVRNQLVPSEHFRRAFDLYRRPPFRLRAGAGCRSALPHKRPPIGKKEIWMYPDADDLSAPPLTSQKRTPPPPSPVKRSPRRPPLRSYHKRSRTPLRHETLRRQLPKRPKRATVPLRGKRLFGISDEKQKSVRTKILDSLFGKATSTMSAPSSTNVAIGRRPTSTPSKRSSILRPPKIVEPEKVPFQENEITYSGT
jgi:hypothetical protein